MNQLLVIGFYLLNFGYLSYFMAASVDVNAGRELMETVSAKVGGVALVVGLIHFATCGASTRSADGPCSGRRPCRPCRPTTSLASPASHSHMAVITAAMAEAIVVGGERAEALRLTVLYDDRCPLCRRLRDWLARQPTLVPVELLAAGCVEVRRRFPGLDHSGTTRVLTVVGSDGAVYEEERAWLVCAWALPAWQPVAEGLGSGRLGRRVAAVATRAVDGYRHRVLARATPCPSCR